MTKEYRLTTQFQAEINLEVNNQIVAVKFNNGQFTGGLRRNGYCTIQDEAIQESLESHPLYKTMFIVSATRQPKVQPVVAKEVIEEPVQKDEPGIYYGITNSQKAKLKILELDATMTHAKLPNKEAVIDYAKEHNLSFPDWEQ
jgi:hypothetical protein